MQLLLKYSLYISFDNNKNPPIDFISKCYNSIKSKIYPLYLQPLNCEIPSKKSKLQNQLQSNNETSTSVTRYILLFYGFIADIIRLNICNIDVYIIIIIIVYIVIGICI